MKRQATLTISEAARLLEVTPEALARAVRQKPGDYPCFIVGDRIVFSRRGVENWLECGSWTGGGVAIDVEELAAAVCRRILSMERAGIEARQAALESSGAPATALSIGRGRRRAA